MSVAVKNRYDYEAHKADAPGVGFNPQKKSDRSLTNQADMEAADINVIMAKYEKNPGLIVDAVTGAERRPMYGDFTGMKNYHQTLSDIRRVEAAFAAQPVAIRNRFKNDVAQLIAFLDDPKNDAEAVELGLKEAPKPERRPNQKPKVEESPEAQAAAAAAAAAGQAGGAAGATS